jgi:hypothetical protein
MLLPAVETLMPLVPIRLDVPGTEKLSFGPAAVLIVRAPPAFESCSDPEE